MCSTLFVLTENGKFYILEMSKKRSNIKGRMSLAKKSGFSIMNIGSRAYSLEARGEFLCISNRTDA